MSQTPAPPPPLIGESQTENEPDEEEQSTVPDEKTKEQEPVESEEEEEVKTAFNSEKEDSPTPESGGWDNQSLHVVVDPYEDEDGSPFDQNGFIGTDPYRAVVSDARDPLSEES